MTDREICVLIQRRVRAGCETAFAERLDAFIHAAAAFPGVRGVFVVQPPAGGRDWGILRRFDGPAERDAFYASPLFADWERSVAPLTEGTPRLEAVSGVEAWFGTPGRVVAAPARWRMAVATLIGVYPLALLLPQTLAPVTGTWPLPLATLVQSLCFVSLLTWAVMPGITRLLRPWLRR
jgi:hypothetical protein